MFKEEDGSPDDVSTVMAESKSLKTHAILCEAGMYF